MIPQNHLRACQEHQVVLTDNGDCPVCNTNATARPTAYKDTPSHITLRWKIEDETLLSALNKLCENTSDEVDIFVSTAEIPREKLPAGYTPQERWFNIVGYVIHNEPTFIKTQTEAKELLDSLNTPDSPFTDTRQNELDPDKWRGIAEPYCTDVQIEQLDASTLEFTLDSPSDDLYSQARKELGVIARSEDLNITTKQAGDRWTDGIIHITH